jgi:hypothetical protein
MQRRRLAAEHGVAAEREASTNSHDEKSAAVQWADKRVLQEELCLMASRAKPHLATSEVDASSKGALAGGHARPVLVRMEGPSHLYENSCGPARNPQNIVRTKNG